MIALTSGSIFASLVHQIRPLTQYLYCPRSKRARSCPRSDTY